jgi:hypothetical protein
VKFKGDDRVVTIARNAELATTEGDDDAPESTEGEAEA